MEVETSDKQDLTCNICNRKFEKIQALSSHRRYLHKIKVKTFQNKVSKRLRKLVKVEPVKLVKKKYNKPKLSLFNMSPPKLRMNVASRIVNDTSSEKIKSPVKKTMFKCPKCIKIFHVYFSAYKHIQKYHCVDAKDQPVERNSSQMIKPVRVEQCEVCHKPNMDGHTCKQGSSTEVLNKNRCMCLGCHKTFEYLETFEAHVKQLHAKNVEIFYFPNNSEYTSWKAELESSTKTKFAMHNSDTKTKQPNQMHLCSHQTSLGMNKTLLCPSFLHITEFKNGFQVFYFKEHYGHSCSEFSSIKHKKYCITPYLKDFDMRTLDIGKDLYEQFKSIMNNITNNSANIEIGVLNTLLDKAFEMIFVLNSSVQEVEHIPVKKNMTDDQITEVLTEVKTYPSRRKPETINKEVKVKEENNENLKVDSPNIPASNAGLNRSFLQSPPSFNDTYKDFVDQTISKQKMDNPSTPKKNSIKKKTVMKTKIGQFKPNVSPKESTTIPLPKISPKRRPSSPTKTPIPTKKPKPVVLNKASGKASISPQLTKESRNPNMSPQTVKSSKETPLPSKKPKPSKSTDYKFKPDLKYEVKEQENDCNILIIKL